MAKYKTMRHFFLAILMISGLSSMAQSNANDIFAAGVEDAERFTNDYFGPLSEGALYSISNGWYNSGKAKPLGGFEISIIGNMANFAIKDRNLITSQNPFSSKKFNTLFLVALREYLEFEKK